MSKSKQVTVQAKINGELVFDRTVDGKKYQTELMRECMRHIDTLGGAAVIRTQVVGARGWRTYSYLAGGSGAELGMALKF